MSHLADEQRRQALFEEIILYDRILNWRDAKTVLKLDQDTRPAISIKVEAMRTTAFRLLDEMQFRPEWPDPAVDTDDFDDMPF